MQRSISECTARQTLKMGYSKWPHRVPLLSAKNRKLRLQFAWAHQNWTIENGKKKNIAWSDEFSISETFRWRVRIWRKQESVNPSCLVSTVQAGGTMVWGIFSWHTLDSILPNEHCLQPTANQRIERKKERWDKTLLNLAWGSLGVLAAERKIDVIQ